MSSILTGSTSTLFKWGNTRTLRGPCGKPAALLKTHGNIRNRAIGGKAATWRPVRFPPDRGGPLPNGEPDLYVRGFYWWKSEVGSKTLGLGEPLSPCGLHEPPHLGAERFEEISIRHSKFAGHRFAHQAASALNRFATSSPAPFMVGIRATRGAERKRIADEQRPATMAALFDALAARAVRSVIVTFEGYGDRGQMEAVDPGDSVGAIDLPIVEIEIALVRYFGAEPERRTVPLAEAIAQLCYNLLSETHAGWENDGAYGESRSTSPPARVAHRGRVPPRMEGQPHRVRA